MPNLTPSETLRAAAARLRELAERANPGPWRFDDSDADFQPCVKGMRAEWIAECGPVDSITAPGARGDHDAHWIATMSPAVAEPLAREMEMHATWIACVEGDPTRYSYTVGRAEYMLIFAASILEVR